ncbi:MAG TPA: 2-oxoglutarate and iron-dependent oxygenase domain-containing protein, partial [Tepidisphaeraceae bacterium]|nr:2-oxoglutarate and iron-dependent oxygenase domain-containing protein [Tepidisphaeraceae bacterium]
MSPLPLIDISALVDPAAAEGGQLAAARAIDAAAGKWGFFYADHHGVDAALLARVVELARAFFDQDISQKMRIPMSAGGLA